MFIGRQILWNDYKLAGHNKQRMNIITFKGRLVMNWVYYGKLYTTKFQAGCFAKRLEQDAWLFGYGDPQVVEVYRSRKGRYGIRYIP